MDPDGGWRRIHPLVQRSSIAVRRHHAFAPVLAMAHRLGPGADGRERAGRISFLERRLTTREVDRSLLAFITARAATSADVPGRIAHESIFNPMDGTSDAPTHSRDSPFSTWTRGLAWTMLGFAEELEFIDAFDGDELVPCGGRSRVEDLFRQAAEGIAIFISRTPPLMAYRTGTPARPAFTISANGENACRRKTLRRSMRLSPWIAQRRPLPRKVYCGSAGT